MLRDCERGLIDRILVKSISRFARNTTECLETVRSLKARGVSVYFEKEGIDTGKVSSEMLTAVFASLAQAESESISKNMRWSYQKRMQMGTYIPASIPFGYVLKDGKITIEPEEADVVRKIYNMPRPAGAGTAVNMRYRIDCIAASAAQGISAVHGATATAASASSGAVSAGWTMATSTATTPRRWMRSRCTEPSLPL